MDLPPISTHSLESKESVQSYLHIYYQRLDEAIASAFSDPMYGSRVIRPRGTIPLAAWEAKYSALEETHEKERLARERRARMRLSQVLINAASVPDLETSLVSPTRPQEEPVVQNGTLNETDDLPMPTSSRPTTPVEMAPLVATTSQIQIMLEAFSYETRYFITPTGHYVRPDPAEIVRTLRGELLGAVRKLDKATKSDFSREPFEMWYSATKLTDMLLNALDSEKWSRDTVITREFLGWLKYVWHHTQKQVMRIRHYLQDLGNGRERELEEARERGPFETIENQVAPEASGSDSGSATEIGVSTNQNAKPSKQPSNRGTKLLYPYPWSDIRSKSNGRGSADSRIKDPTNVETMVNTKRRREDLPEDDMAALRGPARRGTYPLMDEDGERMAKRAQTERHEHSKTA
jgi:hypothetical protein